MFNQILNNITKKNIEKEVIFEMREPKTLKSPYQKNIYFFTLNLVSEGCVGFFSKEYNYI